MRRAGVWLGLVMAACGDRSPPALWPEAPPPTLAEPIGVATDGPPTPEGARRVEPAPAEPAAPPRPAAKPAAAAERPAR